MCIRDSSTYESVLAFATGPLWPGGAPASDQWTYATAQVAKDNARGTATLNRWERPLGPARLGKRKDAGSGGAKELLEWIAEIAAWVQKNTTIEQQIDVV